MWSRYRNSYLSYFLMYLFYFMSWALFATLISVYLLDKGYTASDVSLVVSASFIASLLVQVFVGRWSDRVGRKKVSLALTFTALLGGGLFLLAKHLVLIVLGYTIVLTCLNSSCPLVERTATAAPFAYGKIRLWGTIGYAAGSQFAGLIYEHIAPWAVYAAFLLTMCLTILGIWGTAPKEDVDPTQAQTMQTPREPFARALFGNRRFLAYLVISVVFSAFTTICNTYLPDMLRVDGLSVSTASTILSVAVVFELPLILFAGKFMDRLSSRTIMLIGYVMVLAEFAVYGFSSNLPLKLIITMLMKHPAVMLYTMVNLKVVHSLVKPGHQMTALAIVSSIKSLAAVLGQTIAGKVLDHAPYATLYMGASIVMLCCLALFAFFKSDEPTESLFSNETHN